VTRDHDTREQVQTATRIDCLGAHIPYSDGGPRTGQSLLSPSERTTSRPSAGVVTRDALGRGRIGAAEQHSMNQQGQ
jgi:hypothetical protein